MIIILKLLAIFLGIMAISKTYLDYKKHREGIAVFSFWTITWLVVIAIALYPMLIEKFNNAIGEGGFSINSFIGMVFIFLLFVTYRVFTKANRIETQLRDMVVKLGLKDFDNKVKK